MKGIIWLLFLVPFFSFSQERRNGETNNLLVDSLRNQIIHITYDSLIRLDANNLKVLAKQKILRPKRLLSFTPIIKANKLIFLDNHGGDVFELTEKDSLAKIDNSDIKNFLIGSSIFIKNDTLFRYGGYGYWSISNFFIYLDNATKQWEVYNISNTSSKAKDVHSHFSIDTGNEFYFFGGHSITHNGARDGFSNNEVWSFNFQTKNWHFLGKSKTDFGLDPADFIIDKSIYIINELDDKFILHHYDVPLLTKKTDGPYGPTKPYIKIGIYRIGETGTTTYTYKNLIIKNKKKSSFKKDK